MTCLREGVRRSVGALVLLAGLMSLLSVWPAGSARADYALAMQLYDAGQIEAAAAELRELASAGHRDAQVALAGLYADGDLNGADRWSRAVRWYGRAADAGSPVARMNLGEILAEGRPGVARDRVRAWIWLTLASRQGRAWADERRARLEADMTDEDLARARQRLRARAD